jgi:HSP20 family protein
MLPILRNGTVPTQTGSNRVASLFERFFEDPFFSAPQTQPASVLPLSLWQDENHLHVEADLPGVAEADLEVTMFDGDLFIRGERKCERPEGTYDSRRYGRFEQRIALPTAVESEKVEAKLANGVLRVTLPKSPEAKPRKIAIRNQ